MTKMQNEFFSKNFDGVLFLKALQTLIVDHLLANDYISDNPKKGWFGGMPKLIIIKYDANVFSGKNILNTFIVIAS